MTTKESLNLVEGADRIVTLDGIFEKFKNSKIHL